MELEGIMSHITTSSRWVHTNARISTLFFLLSGRIASSTRVLHSSHSDDSLYWGAWQNLACEQACAGWKDLTVGGRLGKELTESEMKGRRLRWGNVVGRCLAPSLSLFSPLFNSHCLFALFSAREPVHRLGRTVLLSFSPRAFYMSPLAAPYSQNVSKLYRKFASFTKMVLKRNCLHSLLHPVKNPNCG